jgi:hypothetical protein
MASLHRGRQVSAVDVVAPDSSSGVAGVGVVVLDSSSGVAGVGVVAYWSPAGCAAAELSSGRAGRAGPESESGCAVGSAAALADAAAVSVDWAGGWAMFVGAAIMRLTAGKVWTVGTFFAVSATVRTGRRRNSDTRATITGVAAALTIVPPPQMREAANDAAADAMLAMISVCSEIRPPSRLGFWSCLRSGDSTTSA